MKKKMEYGGSSIQYKLLGTGLPVVLLHGFGEDSRVWEAQITALNKYKLLLPDLPGSGSSGMIKDMSMEGLAAAILAILDVENIDRCVLIGHSMGGYITLAFAEQYPERLFGFGLFHSSAYADAEEKKATRRKGIQFIQEHGAYAFLKTATPNLYSPETKEKNPTLIDTHLQTVEDATDAALIAYYESMMKRKDRTAILKSTSLPVLFVLGKWDTAVPLKDGLEQAHLPNLSYIHILSSSGHMGMKEEVENANILLQKYIADIQATT